MENISFRILEEKDIPAILEIYSYYIAETTATCQISPIDEEMMRKTVMPESPRYQSYAIMSDDQLCGYALFTRFKTREAFDNTAEITLYLKQGCTSKGIGTVALKFIENKAKMAGMHVLVSLVSSENASSIRLFERNGYIKCAEFKEVSFKFGRYFNLLCYQKMI